MKNLQDLYDRYLETQPSSGKIKTATSMMIHVCKALNISSQEEITRDYFETIPKRLDDFFNNQPNKALIDKTILAEMIGRVGPQKPVTRLLDTLLNDPDENVRQFMLHSMSFYGNQNPDAVLPYVEKYRESSDSMMSTTALNLLALLTCSDHYKTALEMIAKWYRQDEKETTQKVLKRILFLRSQGKCHNDPIGLEKIKKWFYDNCPESAKVVFEK